MLYFLRWVALPTFFLSIAAQATDACEESTLRKAPKYLRKLQDAYDQWVIGPERRAQCHLWSHPGQEVAPSPSLDPDALSVNELKDSWRGYFGKQKAVKKFSRRPASEEFAREKLAQQRIQQARENLVESRNAQLTLKKQKAAKLLHAYNNSLATVRNLLDRVTDADAPGWVKEQLQSSPESQLSLTPILVSLHQYMIQFDLEHTFGLLLYLRAMQYPTHTATSYARLMQNFSFTTRYGSQKGTGLHKYNMIPPEYQILQQRLLDAADRLFDFAPDETPKPKKGALPPARSIRRYGYQTSLQNDLFLIALREGEGCEQEDGAPPLETFFYKQVEKKLGSPNPSASELNSLSNEALEDVWQAAYTEHVFEQMRNSEQLNYHIAVLEATDALRNAKGLDPQLLEFLRLLKARQLEEKDTKYLHTLWRETGIKKALLGHGQTVGRLESREEIYAREFIEYSRQYQGLQDDLMTLYKLFEEVPSSASLPIEALAPHLQNLRLFAQNTEKFQLNTPMRRLELRASHSTFYQFLNSLLPSSIVPDPVPGLVEATPVKEATAETGVLGDDLAARDKTTPSVSPDLATADPLSPMVVVDLYDDIDPLQLHRLHQLRKQEQKALLAQKGQDENHTLQTNQYLKELGAYLGALHLVKPKLETLQHDLKMYGFELTPNTSGNGSQCLVRPLPQNTVYGQDLYYKDAYFTLHAIHGSKDWVMPHAYLRQLKQGFVNIFGLEM